MAIDSLKGSAPKAVGSDRLNQMIDQIKSECNRIWMDGHQRCSGRSLTGQLCHFAVHDLPDDDDSKTDIKAPKKDHCSGVKTFSMCNCGLTRKIRIDPFSLKEANFAFYQRTDYTFGRCCSELDRYEFQLFNLRDSSHFPNISVQKDERTSGERQQKQKGGNVSDALNQEIEQNLDADEEEGFAMDPQEFNIRFFDDDDEGIPSVEENNDEDQQKSDTDFTMEPMTQNEQNETGKELSGEMIEDEEEGRRKERIIESTEEDEECIDEKADEEFPSEQRSENTDYLETYDEYEAGRGKEKSICGDDNEKLLEKYKGLYLEHVPQSNSPSGLLPIFPSFSVVCIGHSSLYNHSTGIKNSPNFRSGSEFLLPWNVQLTVRTEQWLRELQFIGATPTERTFRNFQHQQQQTRNEYHRTDLTSKEKVKIFIGFDYECPRGHRFMVSEPGKVLRHRRMSGTLKLEAAPLLNNDLPIWMPCPCKKEPRMSAQLMRIHVVTPKAPVRVVIHPLIQMQDDDVYFIPGYNERIELGWAKYYVMRLPYVYIGPAMVPVYRPTTQEFKGKLCRNCIQVDYLPLSDV